MYTDYVFRSDIVGIFVVAVRLYSTFFFMKSIFFGTISIFYLKKKYSNICFILYFASFFPLESFRDVIL